MASCKDCMHYEFCCAGKSCLPDYVNCKYFKDRNRFVEVVRCKDCKCLNKTKMICMNKNNRIFNTGKTVYSNNFCNYGKKVSEKND